MGSRDFWKPSTYIGIFKYMVPTSSVLISGNYFNEEHSLFNNY